MGSAIWERIHQHYSVMVFDKDETKFVDKNNVDKANSLKDLLIESDAIILATKPQDFDNLIEEINLYHDGKLFISIAVGIGTKYLEKKLPMARMVRVMPNLPAQVGKGLSVICGGYSSSMNDINFVENLFSFVGKTLIVDEKFMNIVTAISGSGPGFYFRLVENKSEDERKEILEKFISSLQKISLEFGFTESQAKILAEETGRGAEAYLEILKIDPRIACEKVTSKGGTTEAGLSVLEDINSLKDAVSSALKRAVELIML